MDRTLGLEPQQRAALAMTCQWLEQVNAHLTARLREQPQQVCEQKEATRQIADSIGALREPYRAVSVLYFLQQRPVCEIAQLLCRPDKTINTQIYRARGLLRASLAG